MPSPRSCSLIISQKFLSLLIAYPLSIIPLAQVRRPVDRFRYAAAAQASSWASRTASAPGPTVKSEKWVISGVLTTVKLFYSSDKSSALRSKQYDLNGSFHKPTWVRVPPVRTSFVCNISTICPDPVSFHDSYCKRKELAKSSAFKGVIFTSFKADVRAHPHSVRHERQ